MANVDLGFNGSGNWLIRWIPKMSVNWAMLGIPLPKRDGLIAAWTAAEVPKWRAGASSDAREGKLFVCDGCRRAVFRENQKGYPFSWVTGSPTLGSLRIAMPRDRQSFTRFLE